MRVILFVIIGFASLLGVACSGTKSSVEDQDLQITVAVSNKYPAIGEWVDVTVQAITGTISGVEYDWGDGSDIGKQVTMSHQYAVGGTYPLSIKVVDTQGRSATWQATMSVEGVGLTQALQTNAKSRVWIVAHRASTGNAAIPENSIEALNACMAAKESLDFVEVDPRVTKDGVMVLMHDETVDRTTNGKGKVKDLTYQEIQQLRLKLPNGVVTSSAVPSLYDFLLKARGQVFVNLDFIDKVSPKEVYELVKSCGMLDRVLFTVGTNQDVAQTMFGYSKHIHILGQYSNLGDENYLGTAGGGGRFSFVYITPAKALSTDYASVLLNNGYIPATITLDQNGFTYDSQIVRGDYIGLDMLLAKGYGWLQTDHPGLVHSYLKTKNKR